MIKTLNRSSLTFQKLSRHYANTSELLDTIKKRSKKKETGDTQDDKIKNVRLGMDLYCKLLTIHSPAKHSNLIFYRKVGTTAKLIVTQ